MIKLTTWLSKIYESTKVNQGVIHDYLGMDLDYSTRGEVKISMINPPWLSSRDWEQMATSAAYHLFKVIEEREVWCLPGEPVASLHTSHHGADAFCWWQITKKHSNSGCIPHHKCKKPRWRQLGKLKQHIPVWKWMTMIVPFHYLQIHWGDVMVIDALCTTHEDCCSHVGGVMMLGKGAHGHLQKSRYKHKKDQQKQSQ